MTLSRDDRRVDPVERQVSIRRQGRISCAFPQPAAVVSDPDGSTAAARPSARWSRRNIKHGVITTLVCMM
jgi:hypothetical protein